MRPDGAETDAELVGDFLVEKTLGQQREDFLFAFGQLLHLGGRLLDLLEMADDLARDVHGHGRAAGMHLFDRMEQFARRHVLEQITVRAGAERFKDQIPFLVGRQHQHLGLGHLFLQAGDAFDAAHAGKVDVHEHDVGRLLGHLLQRLFAIGINPHAAQARGALQKFGQTFARAAAVFDDGDTDRHLWFFAFFFSLSHGFLSSY
jgi:hypothetical protein